MYLIKQVPENRDQIDSESENSEWKNSETESQKFSSTHKKPFNRISKTAPRLYGSLVDNIYYTVKGTRSRLRSNFNVKKYCKTHRN